jgi:hypothetical protein
VKNDTRPNRGHSIIVRLYEVTFVSGLIALSHWSWQALEASSKEISRTPGFSTVAHQAPATLEEVEAQNGKGSVQPEQVAHEKQWADSR